MSAINNAYNNGVFIVVSKVTGNIIDLITAPLSPNEILIGLCGGSITRAFITALLIYITLCALQWQLPMHNIFIVLFFIFISSLICALVGIISGLLFDNFEEASLITNYIITPLLFLSGTFYSISKLPNFFQFLIKFNPFFYMIDGTRYGIIGKAEHSLVKGSIVLIATSILLWLYAHWILKRGYRIRK
jgi:ABC-2 type transport system permease protein